MAQAAGPPQCQPGEVAKLASPSPTSQEAFGFSSAISGDTLVVGDPSDSGLGFGAGAIYVFRRSIEGPHEWRWTAKLLAGDAEPGASFGWRVAIDGDVLAVGTPQDSSLGIEEAGAVYVFERTDPSNETWTQTAKLTASDPFRAARFGQSVAVSSSTIAVGAPLAKPRDVRSGAAYLFERGGAASSVGWKEVQRLTPSNGKAGLQFGILLDLERDTLAIGAPKDDTGILQGGAVYVYARTRSRWDLEALVTAPDASINDAFGSVALNGDQLFVGAVGDDDQGLGSGSAYVFTRDETGWEFTQKLLPLAGQGGDNFGASLAAESDLLVVTARNSSAQAADAGIAHSFRRGSGGSWVQSGVLIPSDLQPNDIMERVSLSDGIVVLGIITFPEGGTVHVFDTRLERSVTTYCEPSPTGDPDCTPTLQTLGNATASGTSTFQIRAGPLPAGSLGCFFYTHSPSSLPVGKSAWRCLPGPALGQTNTLSSGGTFGQCDGVFEVDWNEVLAAAAGQDPALGQPGTFVYGQFAYFEFGSRDRVRFTDAVSFVTCP